MTQSPFELTTRARATQAWAFQGRLRSTLGHMRGTFAFTESLARFVPLRLRLRSSAPLVDDSTAFAVATFRSARRFLTDDEARDLVTAQIVESGTALMSDWVPRDRQLDALTAQLRSIMGEASDLGIYELTPIESDDSGIEWDITRCRYAENCSTLGEPSVATAFCAVDQPFVGEVLPELAFSCETTIAAGDDRCRFRVGDRATPAGEITTRSTADQSREESGG